MRVAIVGAGGGIGSSVANALATTGAVEELVLVDQRRELVETHVMDLEQLRVNVRPFEVWQGSSPDAASADLIVVSASVPYLAGKSRMEFLADNVEVMREIGRSIGDLSAWTGCVVLATNPVDPLCTVVWREWRLARERVIGYTVNDSTRLSYGVAEALGVQPQRVRSYVIGEHGDYCVPIWERVTIDGNALALSEDQRDAALHYLKTWYPRWGSLGVTRTSTWTSGAGIARMIEAILYGDSVPWPVSTPLEGEYGTSGISLGVPVLLGSGKVREVLAWDLSSEGQRGMRSAAEYVRDAVAGIRPESAARA